MKSGAITRIWHGVTKREHADEYLEFIIKTGVGDYKAKYYLEDEKYLIEFEPNVIHCETFEF